MEKHIAPLIIVMSGDWGVIKNSSLKKAILQSLGLSKKSPVRLITAPDPGGLGAKERADELEAVSLLVFKMCQDLAQKFTGEIIKVLVNTIAETADPDFAGMEIFDTMLAAQALNSSLEFNPKFLPFVACRNNDKYDVYNAKEIHGNAYGE